MLGDGPHYLDVEGQPSGSPVYQELLYEAARYELAAGLGVDVASPRTSSITRTYGGPGPRRRCGSPAPRRTSWKRCSALAAGQGAAIR